MTAAGSRILQLPAVFAQFCANKFFSFSVVLILCGN